MPNLPTSLPTAACLLCVAGAACAQTTYRIVDLTDVTRDPLGLFIVDATAVNEDGVVVGHGFEPVEGKPVALRWTSEGSVVEVLPLLRTDDNASEAWTIDADGRPLGTSDSIRFEGGPGPIRIFQDPVAVRWDDGGPIAIESLLSRPAPYALASVRNLNTDGQLIGWGREDRAGGGLDFRGWLLDTDNTLTDLGVLNRPRAINDNGLVVGEDNTGQDKAHVWDDGDLINLHDPDVLTGVTSRAFDVNNAGDIVGEAQFHISQPEYATLWRDSGRGYEPIHVLDGLGFSRPQGMARAINEAGTIVGWWSDLDTPPFDGIHAYIMPDGVDGDFFRLIDLVPDAIALGWEKLQRADNISENGWIVGTGVRDGVLGHAFLLIPIECAPDIDGDGQLTIFDFLAFQNLFDDGDLAADFDGDGELTIFDFLAFQNAFDAGCE